MKLTKQQAKVQAGAGGAVVLFTPLALQIDSAWKIVPFVIVVIAAVVFGMTLETERA